MLYRYSMQIEKATIDTVAAACGLSRTTVSAVLRGDAERYRIAAPTALRVRQAAEALGWKANYFARSLNRKRTGTIGVLFPDVFERFMGETVRGIEEALAAADCRMLLSTSRFDPDEELRAIEAFAYRGVDGLIVAPYAPFAGGPSRAEELTAAIGQTPCVVIDRAPDGLRPAEAGYGLVVQADRAAAREATRHLALASARRGPGGTGPARVAFLSFDLAASSVRERRAGYREAAAELGLERREVLLRELNPDSGDLAAELERIDAGPDRPAAWLVSTDGLAYKLAALLSERGRRIGEDALIARFGIDPPWMATGLAGLRQPHRELGRRATELLTRMVGAADGDRAAETIELPVELVPAENGAPGFRTARKEP
jgi:DNA-binding LacI/PurR family transcriptional regulator